MNIKSSYYKITSVGLVAWLITTLVTFAQTNQAAPAVEKAVPTLSADNGKSEKDIGKGETPKPIGTFNTKNSRPLSLPAANVELMSIDGRKIIATVHKFEGSGIKIQTADGAIHIVAYNKLSWETIAKLTGQELSYTKAGMDGFWVMGEAKCSRSR